MFTERGFDGVSVTDIEGAAGLAAGSGAFYRHFPNKEAVFVAAVHDGIDRLVAQADADRAERESIADPQERGRASLRARLSDLDRFRGVWNLVVSERQRFPEMLAGFVDALAMDRWDGGWSTDRREAIAFAAMVGYSQLELLGDGPFRDVGPDEFVDAVAHLLTGGAPPVA